MKAALLAALGAFACAGADGNDGSAQQTQPPVATEALRDWLQNGEHHDWHAWSEVGPTLGLGGARVYLNDALLQSLSAKGDVHPTGAAAVRELYSEDFATVTGYSVLLKVAPGTEFDAWYCFELLHLEPDRQPAVAERGAPRCESCHAQGRDFIQSTLPLP